MQKRQEDALHEVPLAGDYCIGFQIFPNANGPRCRERRNALRRGTVTCEIIVLS